MRPNLTQGANAPGFPNSFATMARTVAAIVCETGPAFPCPYLKGQEARFSGIDCDRPLPKGLYEALMQSNFRRNGTVIYRPVCAACDQCRMARIPVDGFAPNRSQRRCARTNADLVVTETRSGPSAEKHALYARYLKARHPAPPRPAASAVARPDEDAGGFKEAMDGSWDEFTTFLYSTCVETVDYEFRDGSGKLLGVSVVDVEPDSLSAVYCYFEPAEARRSLGVFNVMTLVDAARRRGLAHVYLGYWIRDARKMNYKSSFGGAEALATSHPKRRGDAGSFVPLRSL